jgi:thiol-disulfide isomerase/thioredoxin
MKSQFNYFKFVLGFILLNLIVSCSSSQKLSDDHFVLNISSVEAGADNSPANFSYDYMGEKSTFYELTKGKVVFLNFWGTWCPPCRREIPDIIEIQKDLKDQDFMVIGMALEHNEDPVQTVKDFVKTNRLNYSIFISNTDIDKAYGGISAVPTTYIIDKNGKISEKIVGMQTKAKFMEAINKVLK